MDWNALLAFGFRSRLAMSSYMMLVRLVNCFRNCVWCLPMDVTCFEMSAPLYGGQVNAVHQLVQTLNWASILDTSTFWKLKALLRDSARKERHRLVPSQRPLLERGLLLQVGGVLG
eukprot:3829734-Alexandrium_andersonii.AAC.1